MAGALIKIGAWYLQNGDNSVNKWLYNLPSNETDAAYS
jgi:hypothetical protein